MNSVWQQLSVWHPQLGAQQLAGAAGETQGALGAGAQELAGIGADSVAADVNENSSKILGIASSDAVPSAPRA